MQEVFFTILSIWVIWKLFSAFSGSSSNQQRASNNFYQTNNHYQQSKPEGEVVIEDRTAKSGTKRKSDDGEYVDYEEIK